MMQRSSELRWWVVYVLVGQLMISPLYCHDVAASGAEPVGPSNNLLGTNLDPYGTVPSALGVAVVGVGGAGPTGWVIARYKETH
jgi:hypothetical protein